MFVAYVTSVIHTHTHTPKNKPWLAGKSTVNEDVQYFLLKMGIFQPVMSVFRGGNVGVKLVVIRVGV